VKSVPIRLSLQNIIVDKHMAVGIVAMLRQKRTVDVASLRGGRLHISVFRFCERLWYIAMGIIRTAMVWE
jgi:hypothetical protein